MGPTHVRVVWRCALVEHGALSVMTSGVSRMDLLCACNLDWEEVKGTHIHARTITASATN